MKGEIDFDQTLNRQQAIWSVWQDLAFGNSLLGVFEGSYCWKEFSLLSSHLGALVSGFRFEATKVRLPLYVAEGSFASILACPHEVWSLGYSGYGSCPVEGIGQDVI